MNKKYSEVHSIVEDVLKSFIGEFNDQLTRDAIYKSLCKELSSDFTVKCDQENNPPMSIDRNEVTALVDSQVAGFGMEVTFGPDKFEEGLKISSRIWENKKDE